MLEHELYMREALIEARLALSQGEFPVGVVLVANGQVLARGRRRNSQAQSRNEMDHAEINALRSLLQEFPQVNTAAITLYTTMEPCLMCYASALLAGIRTFVWAYEDVMGGGTGIPLQQLNPLYANMQVQLVGRVLRRESLKLFQHFFRMGDYWQDSLLARYTLAQTLDEPGL
ncbi:MAG: nucleoside deaminase [Desulfobulbaceae bacterium]|nr:nucleoside deaminase [Desulfobulbaceae bacterium]